MKVAPKLIFLFKEAATAAAAGEGVASAFSDALQPNPTSNLRRLEESFDLSLEKYGIKNSKASGDIVHFVDQHGHYQELLYSENNVKGKVILNDENYIIHPRLAYIGVTLLLLQNYESPILACALNEVLGSIVEENVSAMPTLVLPVIISASKLKLEKKYLSASDRHSLYGVQIGPESDTTLALLAKCEKPPPSLEIHYEPLACFLHLARVSKLSTCVIIGQAGHRQSQKNTEDEIEVVHVVGELLASVSSLCFSREKIRWNPMETLKDVKEPWRALYG